VNSFDNNSGIGGMIKSNPSSPNLRQITTKKSFNINASTTGVSGVNNGANGSTGGVGVKFDHDVDHTLGADEEEDADGEFLDVDEDEEEDYDTARGEYVLCCDMLVFVVVLLNHVILSFCYFLVYDFIVFNIN
jgi:hypothetical protein